jgi:hypothetical protein
MAVVGTCKEEFTASTGAWNARMMIASTNRASDKCDQHHSSGQYHDG